jgi:multiple sugar transport system ATP-binding protein
LPERRTATVGASILYGIRPEHLRLDQQGMPASVVLVEPTGSETQVQLRVGERPITAAFRERITARPGEMLHVAPDPAHIHLFDQTTGLRL